MPFDSTPAALDAQRRAWRRLGPTARLLLAIELSDETQRITLAGVKARHPTLGTTDLQRVLVERLYGADPVRHRPVA